MLKTKVSNNNQRINSAKYHLYTLTYNFQPMKKIVLTSSLILFVLSSILTQNQVGIKVGLSSYDLPSDVLDLSGKDIQLSIENANYGVHFGVYARLGLLGFYLQPELSFNSNSVQYRIQDFNDTEVVDDIRTEHYQNIDIPVLIMFTPSIFRVYAGPVGHYFLNSTSELKTINGLKEEFKTLTYGYQAGVGIQILGLSLDVRYEGNFNKFGDHIVIDGEPYQFSSTPSRFLLSVGFKL